MNLKVDELKISNKGVKIKGVSLCIEKKDSSVSHVHNNNKWKAKAFLIKKITKFVKWIINKLYNYIE